MKTRYRLIRRGHRGGGFYCVDTVTGKRSSLGTQSERDAQQIVNAKNQAEHQPALNLQIAKAYLAGTDNGLTTRTWSDALKAITESKSGPTRERWERVGTDAALSALWPRVIIQTRAEVLLEAMKAERQLKITTPLHHDELLPREMPHNKPFVCRASNGDAPTGQAALRLATLASAQPAP